MAKDYDILNDFGQTDVVIDLFNEIEKAYLELSSIFDKIKETDFIIAFFPCTRFEDQCNMMFLGNQYQQKNWTAYKKLNYDLYLHKELHRNYEIITKLVLVCLKRNIPLVIENPKGAHHYLNKMWSIKPQIVDTDRTKDGDYYKKPTQYWFVNCEPKNNLLFEPVEPVEKRDVSNYAKQDFMNENRAVRRSEIHPQYARRFILKYIADYIDGEFVL